MNADRGASRVAEVPQLQASPDHLIRVAQQIHTDLWRTHVGGRTTSIQYACLLAIRDDPMIDQQTLGLRVSLDKATVADVVRRMAGSELIERTEADDDRRRRLLTLTGAGAAVVRDELAAVLAVQKAILAPLRPREQRTLLRTLTKVCDAIEMDRRIALDDRTSLFEAPGHLIRRAQQRHWSLWSRIVGPEVTSVQYALLLGLQGREPLSQVAIGTLASIDTSTAADVLARLQRRGLVARTPDAADARRNLVKITDAGTARVDRLGDRVATIQDLLFEALDDTERSTFTMLMSRICTLRAE